MQRTKTLAFIFLLLFFGFQKTVFADKALDVVISEIAWSGTIASTNHEWIELYNNTDKDVDFTGWTLYAVDGTPKISLTGIVPLKGYFLLERTSNDTISDIDADQIYTGALGNDTGEHLIIKDAGGNIIDEVNSSGVWFAGDNSSKSSMERVSLSSSGNNASNWATNDGVDRNGVDKDGNSINGTPKSANSQGAKPTPTPTPTTSPTNTPTPTKIPTPTPTTKPASTPKVPTPTKIPTSTPIKLGPTVLPILIANDAQESTREALPTSILGESTESAVNTASPSPFAKETKTLANSTSNLSKILIGIGIIFLISCGILAFRGYVKSRKENEFSG